MSSADRSVRAPRPGEAAAIAAVHAAVWARGYAGLLPPQVLAELTPDALTEQWGAQVAAPTPARHHLLVALEGDAVAGVAAAGPSPDRDLAAASDAELSSLLVEPDRRRAGHGSRLLAACVDLLRADGYTRAYAWVEAGNLRTFLEGAGWAPDGVRRSLDLLGDGSVVLSQLRLHTDLTPAAPAP